MASRGFVLEYVVGLINSLVSCVMLCHLQFDVFLENHIMNIEMISTVWFLEFVSTYFARSRGLQRTKYKYILLTSYEKL